MLINMKNYTTKNIFFAIILFSFISCENKINDQLHINEINVLKDSIKDLKRQKQIYQDVIVSVNKVIINDSENLTTDFSEWKNDTLITVFMNNFLVYSENYKLKNNKKETVKVLTDTLVKILPDEKVVKENKKLQTELEKTKATLIQKESEKISLNIVSSKGKKIQYIGRVSNNKANGFGTGIFETGSIYRGEWKNNNRHGKGVFTWKDGEYYDGDFIDDKRNGIGKYYWSNGEFYEGEWKNDMRHGKGAVYKKNGSLKKEGMWKNDKLVN